LSMKLPGGGNIQGLMKQAQQMQQRLQEEIVAIRVEASAGGGMVSVKLDGHKNCLGVTIDPEAAGDPEMLQDMVQAAFNEAARQVDEETQKKTAGMLGGMGLPPGLF
jgi:DNA-binding YbaB/EbfC family protein